MNYTYNASIKTFRTIRYDYFVKVHGIGIKTANFLSDLVDKQTVYSENNLKNIIQSYNQKTNNKIRYNFINNNLIVLNNKLIYVNF